MTEATGPLAGLRILDLTTVLFGPFGAQEREDRRLCRSWVSALSLYGSDQSPAMLVPPPDIDAFWHQYILFTREYATECERPFGGFLHHSPASGEEGEAAAM